MGERQVDHPDSTYIILFSILSGSLGGACPNTKSSEFDLIYTDYIGLSHILRAYKNINNLR